MPTINQLIRKPRKVKKTRRRKNLALAYWKSSRSHSSSFHDSPQKAGICRKIGKTKPRKPNSALRSTARIELTNGREVSAYIPGEGHNLQEHDKVLIQGGRIQDLPGVKYVVIRGVRDTEGVKDRKQGRSLYGKKKDKDKKK